jgi:hypothetical protein
MKEFIPVIALIGVSLLSFVLASFSDALDRLHKVECKEAQRFESKFKGYDRGHEFESFCVEEYGIDIKKNEFEQQKKMWYNNN